MDDNSNNTQITLFSRSDVLLLFALFSVLCLYSFFYLQRIPVKVATDHQTTFSGRGMRQFSKILALQQRGFESYLLAVRTNDSLMLGQSLDYMDASVGSLYSQQKEKAFFVEQVVPYLEENIAIIEAEGISPETASLQKIQQNIERIHHNVEQAEESIWFRFQKTFIRLQTNDYRLNLFYQLIAAATFIVLLLLVLLFRKQRQLISTLNEKDQELRKQLIEQKQTQKVLLENKTTFQRIVENIKDVYFETTLDGTINYCSPSCLETSGYSQDELMGQNASILYNDPNDRELLISALRKKRKVRNLEMLFKKKSGELYDASLNVDLIFDDDENPTGLQGTIRDITVDKKRKTEDQRAKKMEVIGLMAGGVAHDLNNILSGIVGYPEILLQTLPGDSSLRKPIKAIHDSGQRAAMVVADLLTVARGAASTRETHNLNTLIEEQNDSPECEKIKSLYPQIKYTYQLDAPHAIVSCSPVHVKKCLLNLMINAAESMSDSGNITVSTHNQFIDITIDTEQTLKPGEYVVLTVRDSGSGISKTDIEHIFEPFYTKKKMGRSGTGLGLAVVWNTMEDHGGKVMVESSEDGTSFFLYFPLSEKKNSRHPQSSSPEIGGSGETILIVDDESQLRDIGSQMLQTLGYTVHSVSSGDQAIKFVKENQVALIVLDMLMEPGINGRETYEEIIKVQPGQKAIVASGFSESDDVKMTLQLGANGFIKKPYSMEELGRAVLKALKE